MVLELVEIPRVAENLGAFMAHVDEVESVTSSRRKNIRAMALKLEARVYLSILYVSKVQMMRDLVPCLEGSLPTMRTVRNAKPRLVLPSTYEFNGLASSSSARLLVVTYLHDGMPVFNAEYTRLVYLPKGEKGAVHYNDYVSDVVDLYKREVLDGISDRIPRVGDASHSDSEQLDEMREQLESLREQNEAMREQLDEVHAKLDQIMHALMVLGQRLL